MLIYNLTNESTLCRKEKKNYMIEGDYLRMLELGEILCL